MHCFHGEKKKVILVNSTKPQNREKWLLIIIEFCDFYDSLASFYRIRDWPRAKLLGQQNLS